MSDRSGASAAADAFNTGRAVAPLADTHVSKMPGYATLNGAVLLGSGIEPTPPDFDHGVVSSNGWIPYAAAVKGFGERPFVPVRAMVINVPAECFTTDASKFVDWSTPTNNGVRAASIAALIGLLSTPLSKGWLSGSHSELTRQEETSASTVNDEGIHCAPEKTKGPTRVDQYMNQDKGVPSQNSPMVCIGLEDVYNADKTTVLALRVWHFVFDPSHSTSQLARRLMDENADELAHSGAAHQQNSLRRTTVVAAAKASRGLIGSSIETAKLESAAGMVYRHVTNESVYKSLLPHYAGQSDKGDGRPAVDLKSIPRGTLNRRFYGDPTQGCTHPLALEWVMNAKRPDGLAAGLVHLDGTAMDVHPDQLKVDSYFHVQQPRARANFLDSAEQDDPVRGDSHEFRVPDWVASPESTGDGGGRGCFFFQSDPNQLNIFDMALPHAIVGEIKPGRTLQLLFRENVLGLHQDDPAYPLGSSALLNRFTSEVSGRDQWEAEAISAMTDSMVGFDTFDCTPEQRLDARAAKRNAAAGLASYGQKDGDDHVIEPRQVLKENAFTTAAVHAKIIMPWASKQRSMFLAEEQAIRAANDFEHADKESNHPVFADHNARNQAYKETYSTAVRELLHLHIAKMENSFSSAFERESIPVGYRAVYDGLQETLRHTTGRTANIAFDLDMQIMDSNRTVFGTLMNWIGTFFEDDCYIDGRSWGLMQELFFHWCAAAPVVSLFWLALTPFMFARAASSSSTSRRCCSSSADQRVRAAPTSHSPSLRSPSALRCVGNGKTLRTERAQKAFVDGWIVMSGPSSAKSGMQGA